MQLIIHPSSATSAPNLTSNGRPLRFGSLQTPVCQGIIHTWVPEQDPKRRDSTDQGTFTKRQAKRKTWNKFEEWIGNKHFLKYIRAGNQPGKQLGPRTTKEQNNYLRKTGKWQRNWMNCWKDVTQTNTAAAVLGKIILKTGSKRGERLGLLGNKVNPKQPLL